MDVTAAFFSIYVFLRRIAFLHVKFVCLHHSDRVLMVCFPSVPRRTSGSHARSVIFAFMPLQVTAAGPLTASDGVAVTAGTVTVSNLGTISSGTTVAVTGAGSLPSVSNVRPLSVPCLCSFVDESRSCPSPTRMSESRVGGGEHFS